MLYVQSSHRQSLSQCIVANECAWVERRHQVGDAFDTGGPKSAHRCEKKILGCSEGNSHFNMGGWIDCHLRTCTSRCSPFNLPNSRAVLGVISASHCPGMACFLLGRLTSCGCSQCRTASHQESSKAVGSATPQQVWCKRSPRERSSAAVDDGAVESVPAVCAAGAAAGGGCHATAKQELQIWWDCSNPKACSMKNPIP